jgi:hypothetical protein
MIKNLQKELVELELLTAALLGFNAELEKKLAVARGQKLCVVCDNPLHGEDVAHQECYRKEWADVRLDIKE